MAAFTQKATGNWSATGQTTWNQVGVPGDGDTAALLAGATLTVDVDTTIGMSVAATDAITMPNNSTLVVPPGKTLRARGHINAVQGTVLVGDLVTGGGTIIFDATLTAAPTTTLFQMLLVGGDGGITARLRTRGIPGNRSLITSDRTGGARGAQITHGTNNRAVEWDTRYTNFVDLAQVDINPAGALGVNIPMVVDHVTFNGCGEVSGLTTAFLVRVSAVNSQLTINALTITNTLSVAAFNLQNNVGAAANFPRAMTNLSIDKLFNITGTSSITGSDWVLMGGASIFEYASGTAMAPIQRVMLWQGGAIGWEGDLSQFYVFIPNPADHPHGPTITCTYHGARLYNGIFDYIGTDYGGSMILRSGGGAPGFELLLDHIIGVYNGAGTVTPGILCNWVGGNNFGTIATRHCTWVSGFYGQITLETPGVNNRLTNFSNNLDIGDGSANGTPLPGCYKVNYLAASPILDYLVAGAAHHNAGVALQAGLNGKGYTGLNCSVPPGDNDIVVTDPQFFDSSRKLAMWDAAVLGGPGTPAHAIAEMAKRNDDSGFNPLADVVNLITWVRGGWAPQNPALQSADDNVPLSNGWRGAVEGVAAGPAVTPGGGFHNPIIRLRGWGRWT